MAPEEITSLAAVLTAVAAAWGGFLARGSTAVPAAVWAVVAAVALAVESACRATGRLVDPAAVVSARVAVAALGVCPAMSLLGAKRPQHGVWQLIVASLACVLAMPAASATLVRPGSMPDIHPLELFFLPILVLVGWMNFVATRHGPAATLVAAGQALLLGPLLTGGEVVKTARVDAVGGCCLAAGALVSAIASARASGRRGGSAQGLKALVDPPFLALRETIGAAWTLRITDRFNTVADARGWPWRLRFSGLEGDDGRGPADRERQALATCRSILRRFVSAAWLTRRGGMRIKS